MSERRIQPRDVERIREVKCIPADWNLYARIGFLIAAGTIAGFLAGRYSGRQSKEEDRPALRMFEAWPIVYAARPYEGIKETRFTVVPLARPIRVLDPIAAASTRRGLTKIKEPIVKASRPKQPPTAKSTTPPVAGFYTLQVRSYKDPTEAKEFYEHLKKSGYGVWREPYTDPNNTRWTRIFVGRFKTREAALRYQKRFFKQQGIKGIVVLKRVQNAKGRTEDRPKALGKGTDLRPH